MRRTALLLLGFLVGWCGCHGRMPPAAEAPISRPGYTYVRINQTELMIAARSPADLERALNEIGCKRHEACVVEPEAQLIHVVELKPKKD